MVYKTEGFEYLQLAEPSGHTWAYIQRHTGQNLTDFVLLLGRIFCSLHTIHHIKVVKHPSCKSNCGS